jgi:hypothetical protein
MNIRSPLAGAATAVGLAALVSNPALAAGSRTASVLYVADNVNNAVFMFNAENLNAPMLGSITDGVAAPSSIAVDKMGTLFVANTVAGTITIYKSGATSPTQTIAASRRGTPVALAIDKDDSLVAGYDGAGGTATLAFFPKGRTVPNRTIPIQFKHDTIAIGAMVAQADALYVSVARTPYGQSELLRFAPGSSHGVATGIAPGTGEAIDALGNFYVASTTSVSAYAPRTRQSRYVIPDLFGVGQIGAAPDGTLFVPSAQDRICNQFAEPGYVTVFPPGSSHASFYLQSSSFQDPVSVALLNTR